MPASVRVLPEHISCMCVSARVAQAKCRLHKQACGCETPKCKHDVMVRCLTNCMCLRGVCASEFVRWWVMRGYMCACVRAARCVRACVQIWLWLRIWEVHAHLGLIPTCTKATTHRGAPQHTPPASRRQLGSVRRGPPPSRCC